jgi:lactoylglutathione lyase
MPAKAIHSMIRVLDEARSVDFYRRAFGLEPSGRYPQNGFTLVYLKNAQSPFELELTINEGRDKSFDLGDGYGHLAVIVDDLEAEHGRMQREGLKPGDLKTIDLKGRNHFFFLKDPDGYQIEVIGPGGRFS